MSSATHSTINGIEDKDNPDEFDALYVDQVSSFNPHTIGAPKFSMALRRLKKSMNNRIRWVIFGLTWLQLGSVMNCVDVFSFSMVYMEKNATINKEVGHLNVRNFQVYIYTNEEKSTLISAMAIGSLIGMYPQNLFMQRYGARPVLTTASILCAICTVFLPWALDTHFYVALVFRICQGILYSADFGVVGYVCSKWSPLSEVGLSLATLSGFTACRAVVQLPLAGWTVSTFGWRSIYYILSLILVFTTTLWFLFYRDDPQKHSIISSSEHQKILHGRKKEANKLSVPYKKIVSEASVWAVWLAGFADIFASFVFLVYGAQYYKYLGLSAQANAWFNSVKGLLFIGVRIFAGLASDRIRFLSEKSKLRLFNTISLQIPAIFLIVVTFLPRDLPYLHIFFITLYQASFGFNCGGFYKGAALISRQFSYVVIGYIQLFKSLATLIEPLLFSLLVLATKEFTWTNYFMLHAVILTFANLFFVFFVQSEPARFVMSSDLDLDRRKPCESSTN
ncbi:unnamed protein product [Caenorhabditis bovis]|uniref:Major facilitator superfamily (MFS) profile domain-containing protein n=1 Tax=Caenorhabditis bovis TaxID=2654633 RepID=A0A8S1F1T1_9PELO|nr:unnamed protein product [Caenorhabditis bovis]